MCYNRKGGTLMRVKYVICALICMCVTPTFVHAKCDYQRQAELSRIASNVQLAYTYDSTEFTVFVSNLTIDAASLWVESVVE